jgi:hypothetical protein
MTEWSEKPPVGIPGAPAMSPQAMMLAQLLAKQFGQPNAAVGMPQDQRSSTPAITPLGDATGKTGPGSGGGSATMPAGVSGVPPTNMPGLPSGPTERAMPTPSNIPFSYPNTSARQGAVVKTGIENVSEAIHNWKVSKDQDEFQRAKNTMDMYQKAAAINPQTGQPTDPHTMELYRKDPKIVKLWEKYLKLEFPREAAPQGAPGASGGKKAPQGPPIIPPPTAPAGEQSKALMDQKMLEGLRSGAISPSQAMSASEGATAMSPDEWKQAMKAKYGLVPKEKDAKAEAKIDAEIANLKTEAAEHNAQIAKLDAETARLGPGDELRQAQIKAERALAVERLAQAEKDKREAVKSKTLQEFTTVRSSLDSVLKTESSKLTKMQSQAMNERSSIRKLYGGQPTVSSEQESQQERVSAIADAKTNLINQQDDIEAGRISPSDALSKARRQANLDSNFGIWGGMPADAPPAKGLPDGAKWRSASTQEVIGVVEGGKWVAP